MRKDLRVIVKYHISTVCVLVNKSSQGSQCVVLFALRLPLRVIVPVCPPQHTLRGGWVGRGARNSTICLTI